MPKIQYNNTSYRTHGELPATGSRAPDVSLVNTELQNVSFANWMGKRKILNIFVSVDTERDSPRRTDDYAANFGERMLGLGGDYDQVSAAATNFKVSYAVTKTQNNYTVQHTANVYVINPQGELTDVLTFSTAPEVLLGAIQ